MIEAMTKAPRQCLEREGGRLDDDRTMPDRVLGLAALLRVGYDTSPVSKAEWDSVNGDDI